MYTVHVLSSKLNACLNLLFHSNTPVHVYLFIIELDYFTKSEHNNLIISIALINHIKIKKHSIYCKRKSLFIKIYPIHKTSSFAKLFQTQAARHKSVASKWDRIAMLISGGNLAKSGNLLATAPSLSTPFSDSKCLLKI